MSKFLTRDQIYRLLQRELPEDVYPDGQASAFFSTADMASIADVAATGYYNLSRIYDNYFPQYADEYINKWLEKMFVGRSFDPGLSLQELRDRVVAKVRKQPQINLWEVLKVLAGYVPAGTYVQILENQSAQGGWILGESRLGIDTFLNFTHKFYEWGVTDGDYCGFLSTVTGWKLGESQLGLDTELAEFSTPQILEPGVYSYGYTVRIFDYEVTGASYQQMVREINDTEPARSVHTILQNVPIAAGGFIEVVPNVDQFDLVNCITQDPSSTTGYSGLR